MVGQVAAINVFLLAIGLRWLAVSDELFKSFAVSVFVEVVALALVVTRSLFPAHKSVSDEIREIVKPELVG